MAAFTIAAVGDAVSSSVSLAADCANCFGLCCVALPFSVSADFPENKPGGQPCGNLQADFRCGIHAGLRESGWKGCTVFECFGAGQQVSQVTFSGVSWRDAPGIAREMFAVFPVMRQIHEMLSLLHDAIALVPDSELGKQLVQARDDVAELAYATPDVLLALDLPSMRSRIGPLLRQASEIRRAPGRLPARVGLGADVMGADLIGADLQGLDLRGADLHGACLIAANLRGCDLRTADLLGADLRDANLSDTDLREALFLTQPQLNAAQGNLATKIPASLTRPPHWAAR